MQLQDDALVITRKVKVYQNNQWEEIPFQQLKAGMLIKLYDDDQLVYDSYGYPELRCASGPYVVTNENNVKTLAVNLESHENVRSA